MIIGRPQRETIQIINFYIKPSSYSENCGYQLVSAFVNNIFKKGFKYYRHEQFIPYNVEESYQMNLTKDGFLIYPRVEMILDIGNEDNYPVKIDNNYSIVSYSSNLLEESLMVILEGNIDHPDSNIYPEKRTPEGLRESYARITNEFEKISVNLSPQVVQNGKVVGTALVLMKSDDLAFIIQISVHPKHQGKGIGKALMNKICFECSKAGIKQLGLGVTIDNEVAYQLYKKLGFKEKRNVLSIIKHES